MKKLLLILSLFLVACSYSYSTSVTYACPDINHIYLDANNTFHAKSNWNNLKLTWDSRTSITPKIKPIVLSFIGMRYTHCSNGECTPQCEYQLNDNIKLYLNIHDFLFNDRGFHIPINTKKNLELAHKKCESNNVQLCQFKLTNRQ